MAKRGRKSKAELEAMEKQKNELGTDTGGEAIMPDVNPGTLNTTSTSDVVIKQAKPLNEEDIILVKTKSKFIAHLLINKKAEVKHISGQGQPSNPKIWFILATEKMLNSLTQEEQELIENAVEQEIEECVNQSIARKNEEKGNSAAQKRMPGQPIQPSKFY